MIKCSEALARIIYQYFVGNLTTKGMCLTLSKIVIQILCRGYQVMQLRYCCEIDGNVFCINSFQL